MKLTSREDIEAPIAQVHAVLMDFDYFETAARRRGAEITRETRDGKPFWTTSFLFRAKQRNVTVTLQDHQEPSLFRFGFASPNLKGEVQIELISIGPRRTRMSSSLDVRPQTLAARLVIQSLKLARGRVLRRYRKRMAQFTALIETRAAMKQAHGS